MRCSQNIEKVVENLVISLSFVKVWSGNYDKIYQGSYDEMEERAIRDWLSTQGEPKYLNKEYFVRLGRWKTKRQTSNYQTNDESRIIEVTRSAYQAFDELTKINTLKTLRGVDVTVAATILHYLQPDVFPIFDYHVRRSLKRAGLWTRGENDASNHAWLEYLKTMRELSKSLGVTLRELDKALFAYDKFRHRFP